MTALILAALKHMRDTSLGVYFDRDQLRALEHLIERAGESPELEYVLKDLLSTLDAPAGREEAG